MPLLTRNSLSSFYWGVLGLFITYYIINTLNIITKWVINVEYEKIDFMN